jgi:FKBP-type peptidyl-prolyl cis-trans isomerase FkpA
MKYLFLSVLVVLLIACNNEKSNIVTRPGKNEMADLNRYFVTKDRERIQNYIERKNLSMTESKTGLWYQIINQGEGSFFKDTSRILMDYECSLLDGTICYTSKKDGPKEVILGRSEMEPGLNEGLRLLKPGAEAVFIIPPFLGFGLVGDRKMIPSRAIIVYKINILLKK